MNSANSRKLINHWSINWAEFKDPHCYLCLHGTVVACWFITQEVWGSNTPFCKNNSTDSVDSLEFIKEKLEYSIIVYIFTLQWLLGVYLF